MSEHRRYTHRLLGSAAAVALLGASGMAHAWVDTATKGFPFKSSIGLSAVKNVQPLRVVVSLNLRNEAELKQYIKDQHTVGSLSYGTVLKTGEFTERYAPTTADAQKVANYLNSMGFTNVVIQPGRTLISASGTAAVAQKAFNTTIKQFSFNGKTAYSNITTAQVPDSISGLVRSVVGLDSLSTMTTHHSKADVTTNALPALNFSYNASEYQTVYNAGTTPTGSGTSLAISSAGDDLSQVVSDLRQYEEINGLPQVPVRIVNVQAPGTDTSGDGEWALDSQSSSGIAGDLKEIVFYNSASLSNGDLLLATNQFAQDNRSPIGNMSYGGCDVLYAIDGGAAASDASFMQAAAQGQTWFASSGDAGAACTVLINLGLPDSGPISAEYPASSPYVVAVGGTTLLSDSGYNYVSELSWDAGGGGTSYFEPAPDWQSGVALLATVAGLRAVPDIAMDADPNTGASIVVGGDTGSVYGGTSLASPLAAGSWARLQSARCNTMTFAAPLIYALSDGSTATGFHDVVLGTNGLWIATPGWDYTTGFGSFDISAVNAALPAGPDSCPADPDAPAAGSVTVVGYGATDDSGSSGSDASCTTEETELTTWDGTVGVGLLGIGASPVDHTVTLPDDSSIVGLRVRVDWASSSVDLDMTVTPPSGTAQTSAQGSTTYEEVNFASANGVGSAPPAGDYTVEVTPYTNPTPGYAYTGTAYVTKQTCDTDTSGGTTGGDTTGGDTTGGSTTGGDTGTTTGPVAKLSASQTTGPTPLQVTFDASDSTLASDGAAITQYTFYFGDGTDPVVTTSPTVSYTYPAAGSFDAKLVITDADGSTATSDAVTITPTTSVTVTGSDHAVAAMIVTPTSGSVPLTVTFDGSRSFGADGNEISSYTWDFGDGSNPVTTTTATTSHVYTTVGTFTPSLTVTDSANNVSPQAAKAQVQTVASGGSTTGGATTGGSGSSGGSSAATNGNNGGALGSGLLSVLAGFALLRRRRGLRLMH
ncbi:protease pro-enzyme activation domain-containing protein [Solimonas marina]|uniref:PKD domain-containing protein n=1 Tax=Solimonas marina TaxID=2714601 RepID=A0A970B8I0_9GAMM|nr:protease pro-enzyme activation domain-containing protein [Solimonas marina]NKF22299.1 PKD domain-containing protein [Solimonas marina]